MKFIDGASQRCLDHVALDTPVDWSTDGLMDAELNVVDW